MLKLTVHDTGVVALIPVSSIVAIYGDGEGGSYVEMPREEPLVDSLRVQESPARITELIEMEQIEEIASRRFTRLSASDSGVAEAFRDAEEFMEFRARWREGRSQP